MNKIFKISVCLTMALAMNMQTQAQYARKFKLPAARTQHEKELMMLQKPEFDPFLYGKTGLQMPPNVRYPGEFEESQAVVISWAPDFDANGNIIGIDDYSV